MNEHEYELLSRHLDGELRGPDRDAAMALLDESPEAREMLVSLQEMSALAQEAFPRTRFHYTPAAPARRPAVRRMAALAAAILVIVAGGLVYAALEQGWFGWGTDSGSQTPSAQETVATGNDGTNSATSPPDGTQQVAESAPSASGASSADETKLTGHIQTLDGENVQGATVYALCGTWTLEQKRKVYATTHSAADGRFDVDFPPLCYGILVQKPGFDPEWVSWRRITGASISIEVFLRSTNRCTGRVVSEKGVPVIGATIQSADSLGFDDLVAHETSDESGKFTTTLVHWDYAWASHPEYAWTRTQLFRDETATTTMRLGGQLRVRVTKQGAPVANALAMVSGTAEQLPKTLMQRTGADGTALFTSLPPELDYAVMAATEDGDFIDTPTGSTYIRAKQVTECVLALPDAPPMTLSGTVCDPDGKPFPHAMVNAHRPQEPGLNREVPTRPDGTYTLSLETGVMTVAAYTLPGYGFTGDVYSLRVTAGRARQTHNFTLQPAKACRIVMRDASGNPVTTAYLYGHCESRPTLVLHTPDGIFETTPPDSEFRLVDPATNMFASVRPMGGSSEESIEVVFNKLAEAITGRVVDTSGQPLQSANIFASLRAVTGSTGTFTIYPLDPDAAQDIDVEAMGFQAVGSFPEGVKPGSPPVEIVMAPQTAVLSGHVIYSDGTPAKDAQVTAKKGPNAVAQPTTDAVGAFIAKVAAGAYRLEARGIGIHGEVSVELAGVAAPDDEVQLVFPEPAPEGYAEKEEPEGPEYQEASDALKQMGIVFKMFSGEAEGEKYPELDKRFGVLLPDLAKLYPEYITDSAYLNRLSGKQQARFAYLGYAVNTESMANAFLDAYEQYGPEGLAGEDVQGDEDAGITVYRLRVGVERFYIKDINDPNPGGKAQAQIPVLWELPGSHEEQGGYVLYLDGHVEWLPYPGPFPMTETLVSRIQGITAQAQK
ncbi:MAG: carboxypeptidase-like regulatory domain-containing protein [Candidatus Hydrogenedentales bacterium]|jgi:hypothetical protein